MSDLGLIGLLEDAVELLKGVEKDKRAKDANRLATFYRPMFESFLKIHANYLGLFQHAEASLVDAVVHPRSSGQVVAQLQQYFASQRQEFDGVRTHLRSLAANLVRSAATASEQRFLWALLCYFLEHEEPIKSIEQLDKQVSLLLREGPGATLPTPSTYILKLFSSSSDPQKLHKATKRTVEALSGYCSSVCVAYAEVQVQLGNGAI